MKLLSNLRSNFLPKLFNCLSSFRKPRIIIISVCVLVFAIATVIFAISSMSDEETLLEPQVQRPKVRILIDAGHTASAQGGVGPIGAEHEYTYKVSRLLADLLDKDDRFDYEISRDSADGDTYSDNIVAYGASNKTKLLGIIKTKVLREKRGWLTDAQYVDMYSIRHYAIENRFDCLISIHFDVANKKFYDVVEGFHVLVSPYNRQFDRSFELASIISTNFMKEYGVARGVRHDTSFPAEHDLWQNYNRLGLLANGIGFRSLVVVGDVFENAYYMDRYNNDSEFVVNINDIPSVLLEVGYLHEQKFADENTLKDVASRIHQSLENFFVR